MTGMASSDNCLTGELRVVLYSLVLIGGFVFWLSLSGIVFFV